MFITSADGRECVVDHVGCINLHRSRDGHYVVSFHPREGGRLAVKDEQSSRYPRFVPTMVCEMQDRQLAHLLRRIPHRLVADNDIASVKAELSALGFDVQSYCA